MNTNQHTTSRCVGQLCPCVAVNKCMRVFPLEDLCQLNITHVRTYLFSALTLGWEIWRADPDM